MTVTFVTAFFPLPSAKHSIEAYRAHFASIVALERRIILFLDQSIDWNFPPHVHVVRCSLRDMWSVKMIPDTALLPSHRSAVDTVDYMRIMLAKTEFLFRATEIDVES